MNGIVVLTHSLIGYWYIGTPTLWVCCILAVLENNLHVLYGFLLQCLCGLLRPQWPHRNNAVFTYSVPFLNSAEYIASHGEIDSYVGLALLSFFTESEIDVETITIG